MRFSSRTLPILIDTMSVEVVLSVLIKTFKFTASDKDIVWNLGGIKYPTVGYESNKPSMPITVEVIE